MIGSLKKLTVSYIIFLWFLLSISTKSFSFHSRTDKFFLPSYDVIAVLTNQCTHQVACLVSSNPCKSYSMMWLRLDLLHYWLSTIYGGFVQKVCFL